MRWTSTALLASVLGVLLLLAPPAVSGSGDGAPGTTTGDSGRGDNPVVGSLPVEADDDLLGMFFRWTGEPASSGVPVGHLPTLGLVGDQDLEQKILFASGDPNGLVSSWTDFEVFGLVHNGQFTVTRADAKKRRVVLAQWLSDEYFGGTMSVSSTVGNYSFTLNSRTVEVGLDDVARGPGIYESAVVTITPSPEQGGRTLVVLIDVLDTVVTVTYLA